MRTVQMFSPLLAVLAAASCSREQAPVDHNGTGAESGTLAGSGSVGNGGRPSGMGGTRSGGAANVGGTAANGGTVGNGGVSSGGGVQNVGGGVAGDGGGAAGGGMAGDGGGTTNTGGGAPGAGGSVSSGGAGSGGAASGGASSGGGAWAPRLHTALPLDTLSPSLGLYNPHRPGAATVKGSGHTHCDPDHSGMEPAVQEARLRDLPGAHHHDFVWMTAHNFVAPNPGVSGILHMFGVEVYVKQASGASPHMLAYLPNGSLADTEATPFGYYSKDVMGAAEAIRKAGGLPALAHPLRYALPDADVSAMDERLWGIEVLSGSSNVEQNLGFIDKWLSSGKYACLTAGGDIHDEDWSVTRGHQVVTVPSATPTMSQVFDAVAACNFFACGATSTTSTVVDPPELRVTGGAIEIKVPSSATLRFIGRDGAVLSEKTGVTSASYTPSGSELYVRVEAVGTGMGARCYSQPLWLVKPD